MPVDAVAGVVHQVIERLALPGLAQRGPQPIGERGEASDVAGVELEGDRLAAHCRDLGDDGLCVIASAPVGEDDVAVAGDAKGGISAKAAAGAG